MRSAPNNLVRLGLPLAAALACGGAWHQSGVLQLSGSGAISPDPTTVVVTADGNRRQPGGSSQLEDSDRGARHHHKGRPVDEVAEDYVALALALGRVAPREIDGYSGPAWRRAAAASMSADAIARQARDLGARLDTAAPAGDMARRQRLRAQLSALHGVAASYIPGAARQAFDVDARDLYGVDDVTAVDTVDVEAARRALAQLAPGRGPLADRVAALRARFVVPVERRREVFEAALKACRSSTAAHWPRPADERVQVTWGLGGPWGAWHRYQGGYASTLEMSTAAMAFADSMVDVACHETWPGHHAQFVLVDRAAGDGRTPPVELTVAMLRSPLATLREGAASYAVDLAWPPPERLRLERDVLMPLAGLDPNGAASMLRVRDLLQRVEPAIAPILRDYRDGRASRDEARDRLRTDALVDAPEPLLRFVDDLGAYVVGYGVARTRVAAAVEARAASAGVDRWRALGELLIESNPTTLQKRRPGTGTGPDPDRR